jgi:hypothetical protein
MTKKEIRAYLHNGNLDFFLLMLPGCCCRHLGSFFIAGQPLITSRCSAVVHLSLASGQAHHMYQLPNLQDAKNSSMAVALDPKNESQHSHYKL